MLNVIHTKDLWIYKLLQIEEALLRNSQEDWCLINEGSSPAIVHGIQYLPVPSSLIQIRRMSGGGSVVVDNNTIFLTFIFSKRLSPGEMMTWVFQFLQRALLQKNFCCIENDFVLNNKKCGGNAQYFTAKRSLQHTSLLWDYDPSLMSVLPFPQKAPKYRKNRSHEDFLCKLRDCFAKKERLIDAIKHHLFSYNCQILSLEDIAHICQKPFRQSTQLLDNFPEKNIF